MIEEDPKSAHKDGFEKKLAIFLGVDLVVLVISVVTFILILNHSLEMKTEVSTHQDDSLAQDTDADLPKFPKPQTSKKDSSDNTEGKDQEENKDATDKTKPLVKTPPKETQPKPAQPEAQAPQAQQPNKDNANETAKPEDKPAENKPIDFSLAKKRSEEFYQQYGIKILFGDDCPDNYKEAYVAVDDQSAVISAIFKIEPVFNKYPAKKFFTANDSQIRIIIVKEPKENGAVAAIPSSAFSKDILIFSSKVSSEDQIHLEIFSWMDQVLKAQLGASYTESFERLNPADFEYGKASQEHYVLGKAETMVAYFINQKAQENAFTDRAQTFLHLARGQAKNLPANSPLRQKAIVLSRQITEVFPGAPDIDWLAK